MRLLVLSAVGLLACAGPPAPDLALCQDVIQRLCNGPICAVVDTKLAPGTACVEALTARSGCGADDFALGAPLMTRDRFLECRIPLVRNGASRLAYPGCDNVAETFIACPDLVRFLGGTP